MVILFVDMLGVKGRWIKDGRAGAEKIFQAFRGLVAYSLKETTKEEVLHGVVESDSAILVCDSASTALRIGQRLYKATFMQKERMHEDRYWFRGVIVPCEKDHVLQNRTHFNRKLNHVDIVLYKSELMDAIQVEKSGFKGMRLLIDKTLVTESVNKEFAINIHGLALIPIKQLRNSPYPSRIDGNYLDYLWMASNDADEIINFERQMALRLRHAAKNIEEFLQAAATQVVFHECSAIIGSLRTRREYQIKKGRVVAKRSGRANIQ